jgi:general secretion pathway protein L
MPRSSFLRRPDSAGADPSGTAGIWSLGDAGLSEVERFDLGPAIVLVPTESVLLLAVDLPLPGLRRRTEALPFAIEDRIAEPLAAVHLALGAEIAPQRHLAGIVSHAVMQGWVATLDAAGLTTARIVPDALALPAPAPGFWSVDLAGGRALVRTDDGTGFALPADHLHAAWAAAGRPRCIAYGDSLPVELSGDEGALEPGPLALRLARPALDLRQGAYGVARGGMSRLGRRIALVAAAGLVAHGAIAAADTIALNHIASERAAETRTLLTQVAPNATIGDDVAASASDLLPENGSGPSRFLPLMMRVSGALKQLGPAVSLRSVAFDAGANTLSLELETATMEGLQTVSPALRAQGLSAESGSASMNQGKAVGAFLVRSAS